jgi:S1-C subfamily serine protease
MKGMGAEKAGLKSGDRILAVNGWPVSEREELVKTLRQFREGQVVKLRVQREKEEFEAPVPLMLPKPDATGRGLDREDRMNRMGSEPSERAEGFELAIQHDTVLQNWQCGGPLVNLDGKAVGLNIARAGRVASYALPADLAKRAIDKLRRSGQAK